MASRAKSVRSAAASLPLSALLSRALLAFAILFEREAEWPLAVSANVFRVLHEEGVRIRDLPLLSGISKEAIQMAMGLLMKRGAAIVEAESQGKWKIARLTSQGAEAQVAYRDRTGEIEKQLQARFGKKVVSNLRHALQRLTCDSNAQPLLQGLEPYPEGWRAAARTPELLPHYPMILHRGGFPDGS